MPNDHGQIVPTSPQDIAALPLNQAIDAYAPNFAAVLPANVSLDHFKRMVVTAINTNPDLAQADRRSLFNACVKCASDGLLPDGREAALVVFNTKVKRKVGNAWQEEWVKQAQYMPMIAGIRKRMRNSGEVVSATAEVVCQNDEFDYALGDDPFIKHKPAPFERSRGRPVGAYAIIRLRDGETIRDVMRRDEIEAARSKSRAKDSLMWTDFWGEGAKKTVLRRCAKAAPQSAVMESLLSRDEELPELPKFAELAPPEPEPPRGRAITHEPEPQTETDEYRWTVTDADGELHEFNRKEFAVEMLADVMADAARRGATHVAAFRENNAALIAEFQSEIGDVLASTLGEPPHSPAGDHSTSERKNSRAQTDAEPARNARPAAAQTPAGDTTMPDLLGGKPRRAPSYHVTLQDETSDGWKAWRAAMTAMIDAGDDRAAILRDNKDNLAIYEQVDAMDHNRIMRMLEGR